MSNDITIRIKARNEVKGATDAASRDLNEMRKPMIRSMGTLSGLGQMLKGDVAGGFARMAKGLVGAFGSVVSAIGLAGGAFAAAFRIGGWIRDITGLGAALDKLIAPAAVAARSIRDMTKERLTGFTDGLKATKEHIEGITQAAQRASQAIGAMAEKRQALADAETEKRIGDVRAAMPEGPVRTAAEKAVMAKSEVGRAESESKTANEQLAVQKTALDEIRATIARAERDMAAYKAEIADSTAKARELAQIDTVAMRPKGAVAEVLGGAPAIKRMNARADAIDAERAQALAKARAATDQLAQTEKLIVDLKSKEAQQSTAVTEREAAALKAGNAITKAKREQRDAQDEIAKAQKEEADRAGKAEQERLDLLDQIKAKELEIAQVDVAERWQAGLEKATEEAAALRDMLKDAAAKGEVGGKAWHKAQKDTKDAQKESAKLIRERERLKIGQKDGQIDAGEALALGEQGRSEQLQRARIMRRLGLTGTMAPEKVIAAAEKRGIKLNDEDKAILARTAVQDAAILKERERKIQEANVKGVAGVARAAEREARQKELAQLQDKADLKQNDKAVMGDLLTETRTMNAKLVRLLQAQG